MKREVKVNFEDASANIKLIRSTMAVLEKQSKKARIQDPEIMCREAGSKWRRTTDDFINLQKIPQLKKLMWDEFGKLLCYNN